MIYLLLKKCENSALDEEFIMDTYLIICFKNSLFVLNVKKILLKARLKL